MNYLNMSAFNAQCYRQLNNDNCISFVTLDEVKLPGAIPKEIIYETKSVTGTWNYHPSYTEEQYNWYVQHLAVDMKDKNACGTYNISVYMNTIKVLDVNHQIFKYVLWLGDMLEEYIPKCSFGVSIGSEGYGSLSLHTMTELIRRLINSMYDSNILTTFCITYIQSNSYRNVICNHKHWSETRDCFWCYLRDNKLPYGIYLYDKRSTGMDTGYAGHHVVLYTLECVIYDNNVDVIEWLNTLQCSHIKGNISFNRLKDKNHCGGEHRGTPICWHPQLWKDYAYLTPERLSLLIKLMQEDSHLLDKIYGTSSCKLVSETIIDVPPSDKSSIETQTEPPRGLLSRIFGL